MRPWEQVVFYSEPFLKRMAERFPSRASGFHHLGFPSNIAVNVTPHLAALAGRIKSGWVDPRALVLYFGHISPGRWFEDLSAAIENLAGRGLLPQVAFVSKFDPVNDDYHRELLARIRATGTESQVSLPGQLTPEQVSHFFQVADVVALPFPEGASFKNGTLAAALSHGAAIVTTITDLTESALKVDGVLATYSPGDVAGLADRMFELLTIPGRRMALGEAGRKVAELLTWENYIRKKLEIYTAAAGKVRS